MEAQKFMEFILINETSLKEARDIEKRLNEARELGYANNQDGVLRSITNMNYDFDSDIVTISNEATVFPKDSLRDCGMFNDLNFQRPLLSNVIHTYTAKNLTEPEKYFFHERKRRKVLDGIGQGFGKIGYAAGYDNYIENGKLKKPAQNALEELYSETPKTKNMNVKLLQDDGEGLILKQDPRNISRTLSVPMNYVWGVRRMNPLLSFLSIAEDKGEYGTVETLEEFMQLPPEANTEVERAGWIKAENTPKFWDDVERKLQVFSMMKTDWKNLESYMKHLAK
jgi:hypothetical protein